jgi:hypothetical protein
MHCNTIWHGTLRQIWSFKSTTFQFFAQTHKLNLESWYPFFYATYFSQQRNTRILNVVHTEILSEHENCGYLPVKERRVDELSCISLHLVNVNVTTNAEQVYVSSGTNGDNESVVSHVKGLTNWWTSRLTESRIAACVRQYKSCSHGLLNEYP